MWRISKNFQTDMLAIQEQENMEQREVVPDLAYIIITPCPTTFLTMPCTNA